MLNERHRETATDGPCPQDRPAPPHGAAAGYSSRRLHGNKVTRLVEWKRSRRPFSTDGRVILYVVGTHTSFIRGDSHKDGASLSNFNKFAVRTENESYRTIQYHGISSN